MRPTQVVLLMYYSLTLSFAVAATIFAYVNFAWSVVALLLTFGFSSWSLAAIRHATEEHNPYLVWSEKIALLGIMIFVPLIFISNILTALLALIFCAVFALNFQLFDFRRLYIGLAASLMGICVGAAHTKSGAYFWYFYCYMPLAALVLAYAHLSQQAPPPSGRWWRGGQQLGVIGLLVVSASTIYLVLPRLPAGNLGGHPGSGVFYREKAWENQAEQHSNLEGEALARALDQLPTTDSPESSEQRDDPLQTKDPFKNPEPAPEAAVLPESTAAEETTQGTSHDQQEGDENRQTIASDAKELDLSRHSDKATPLVGNPIIAYVTATQPLYLRSHIYDIFDGQRWSSSSSANLKVKVDRRGLLLSQPEPGTSLVSYDIELAARLPAAVPLAAVVSRLRFPATALSVDKFGQISAPGPLSSGTRYSAESVVSHIQGRVFSELPWQAPGQYLQLPDELDTRIAALAAQLTSQAPTQLAAAIMLEQHLRNNYRYSFESIFISPGVTPLKEFLFETKQGHCEYFASALAILLRTQKIPARLVTGYSASQQNPLTGLYEIHALDAHAWVEAYVDRLGWVQLEPTAYYQMPQTTATPLSVELINRYVEQTLATHGALPSAATTWEDTAFQLWQSSVLAIVTLLALGKLFWLSTWLFWLLTAGLTVAGYFLWQKIKPEWQIKRLFRDAVNQAQAQPSQAMDIYLAAIEGILALAGQPRAPGLTIEQFTQQLRRQFGDLETERMSRHFNIKHYHQRPTLAVELNSDDYAHLLGHIHKLGFKGVVQQVKIVNPTS